MMEDEGIYRDFIFNQSFNVSLIGGSSLVSFTFIEGYDFTQKYISDIFTV